MSLVMESFDGVLLVPPDRGQILGRAIWKPRYVVVGRRGARGQYLTSNSHRPPPSRTFSQNAKLRESIHSGEYTIAIYKSKNDSDPIQQYPVSSMSDCQVQQVAHRKQGPVLPTLVITIADKEKKRRSSRAAGLMSTKESTTTTLWLRTPPDDHHHSLHEWRQFLLAKRLTISPESPVSPTFTNPFSSRPRDTNEGGGAMSSALSFITPYSRDRDNSANHKSSSPSLRSKCSDVSSPTSAIHPSFPHRNTMIPGQKYTTVLPTDIPADLPSPAESGGDGGSREMVDGWTAAQLRSASISTPGAALDRVDRRHASISAGPAAATRETILDRAFQLRCIPGSERAVPGEEKLSSLARFDALMRESEERRRKREEQERAERAAQKAALRGLESSEEDSDEDEDSSDDSDSDEDDYRLEQDREGPSRRQTLIPPATQRALEFITGRSDGPESPRTPRRATLAYDVDSFPMPPTNGNYRPQTSYALRRPDLAPRTQSQPHLVHEPGSPARRPPPTPLQQQHRPQRQDVAGEDHEDVDHGEKQASLQPGTANAKRPGFTEFARRLSSTSSLLLVQTNVSGASSARVSSELEYHPVPPLPRSSGGPGVRGGREGEDKRCGWRNSVGVVGAEGGFL